MPDIAQWRGWQWQGGDSARDLQDSVMTAQPLQPGDVLVRNAAIGLNPVDWKVLESQVGLVPGVDGAGTVVAVASDVDPAWLGARVAYHQSLRRNGSFAEYTPVAAQVLMRVPEAMDFASAAAFPCPALTAWQAITKLPLLPGAEVLIAGAGGSVGHFLVQLAHVRGFVVTTLSHPRHWDRLKALGAKRCVEDTEHNAEPRYFAAIDAVGPQHAASLADALLANGHLVCIQGRVEQWPCSPFGRAISLHEVALGALHTYGSAQQWQALTRQGEQLLAQLADGRLQSETLLQFPYEQLPRELQALQYRNFSGKQIIVL
ncbi:alcohol dehydrogenase catalytic domain-containing protein [Candidatus Pantoea multigeneris]|nr:alcohol dehydrogenase catalytic domain-containing protein [Pantoea multigeneris]